MARKTKAELQREQYEAQEAAWVQFELEYPDRFARVLYEFGRRGHEKFSVTYNPDNMAYDFKVDNGVVYAQNSLLAKLECETEDDRRSVEWALSSLEGAYTGMDQHNRELEELAQKRLTALNKLTREEKELLGL